MMKVNRKGIVELSKILRDLGINYEGNPFVKVRNTISGLATFRV
jgi:hypothetical protein